MTDLTPTQAIANRRRAAVALQRAEERDKGVAAAKRALTKAEQAEADCRQACEERQQKEAADRKAAETERHARKRRALRLEAR